MSISVHRVAIALCIPVILLLAVGCRAVDQQVMADTGVPTVPVVESSGTVMAEGKIVPAQYAYLSPAVLGEVVEVLVEEGDQVISGQVLLRLDAAQQQAAVAEAGSALKVADASLFQIQTGPDTEQVAAAEAAVATAQGAVRSAEGSVAAAQAQLARLQAGASAEQIAIAQHGVEAAKNALWASQAQRDSVCGQQIPQSNCDAAQATVQRAEEEVRIAELRVAELQKGASQEDIDAAKAQVVQAQGQLESARAGVTQAEAALALLRKGSPQEAVKVAEAQVDQARAALQRAQVALADTELRAPVGGTVAMVNAKMGERVSPNAPALSVADLSRWKIETSDLTEMEVVHVSVGQPVTIVPDALPNVTLRGTVEAIDNVSQEKLGDVTYTVRIALDEADPRLRWGMTVAVTFDE